MWQLTLFAAPGLESVCGYLNISIPQNIPKHEEKPMI
jgi:hypothetical protein